MSPVVFFTDNPIFKERYQEKRKKYKETTRVIMLKRSDYWSFSLIPRIRKIFSRPKYPRHPPNTVVPEYPAVMSAKYDFLEKSIRKNYFKTKYYMWLGKNNIAGYAVIPRV